MIQIADQHDAYVLSDMAHISGLVAADEIPRYAQDLETNSLY